MKEKKYKVKIENGEIKLPGEVDPSNIKEGMIIFFEEEKTGYSSEEIKSLLEMAGTIKEPMPYKELTPELIDSTVYDEQ